MKQQLKFLVFICLVGTNTASAFASNTKTIYKSTQIRRHGQIIELQLNIDKTDRNAPLEELAAALENNPTVSQFKVSWIAVVGAGNYKGVAIYNRAGKTVNLYAYETFEETVYRYHRAYSIIDDKVLFKTAQLHKVESADDNGPSVLGFFQDLTKYGGKEHKFDLH